MLSQTTHNDNMFLFYNNELLTDCIIVNKVTNKEYLAHRVILAAGSKYFFHLLVNQAGTLTQKDNKFVLELPEKLNSKFVFEDDDAIPILLKYLYSNQNSEAIKSEFTNKNIFQIMALSHSLGIKSLNTSLNEYIIKTILTEDNCGRVFYESIVYDNQPLMDECLNILKNNFFKVSKNLSEFQIILDLPYNIFKQLITSDDLVVHEEKEICDIVLNYIKIRKKIIVENINVEGDKKEEKPVDKPVENVDKVENPVKVEEKAKDEVVEELNFVEKNKKQLEDMKKKMIKSILIPEEERSLIEAIRLSYLTHSELLSISLDEIMLNHKDLVLEGLSMRLNNYEKNQKSDSFKINKNHRKYIGNLIYKIVNFFTFYF